MQEKHPVFVKGISRPLAGWTLSPFFPEGGHKKMAVRLDLMCVLCLFYFWGVGFLVLISP